MKKILWDVHIEGNISVEARTRQEAEEIARRQDLMPFMIEVFASPKVGQGKLPAGIYSRENIGG
jgi:hypothetical protein